MARGCSTKLLSTLPRQSSSKSLNLFGQINVIKPKAWESKNFYNQFMKSRKLSSKQKRFALPHGLRGNIILPQEVYQHPDVIAAIVTIQRGYRAAMNNRYSNLLKNLKQNVFKKINNLPEYSGGTQIKNNNQSDNVGSSSSSYSTPFVSKEKQGKARAANQNRNTDLSTSCSHYLQKNRFLSTASSKLKSHIRLFQNSEMSKSQKNPQLTNARRILNYQQNKRDNFQIEENNSNHQNLTSNNIPLSGQSSLNNSYHYLNSGISKKIQINQNSHHNHKNRDITTNQKRLLNQLTDLAASQNMALSTDEAILDKHQQNINYSMIDLSTKHNSRQTTQMLGSRKESAVGLYFSEDSNQNSSIATNVNKDEQKIKILGYNNNMKLQVLSEEQQKYSASIEGGIGTGGGGGVGIASDQYMSGMSSININNKYDYQINNLNQNRSNVLSEIFIGQQDCNNLAIRTDMSGIKVNEIEISPFKSDKAAKVALRKLKRERNQFFSSVGQELDLDLDLDQIRP